MANGNNFIANWEAKTNASKKKKEKKSVRYGEVAAQLRAFISCPVHAKGKTHNPRMIYNSITTY